MESLGQGLAVAGRHVHHAPAIFSFPTVAAGPNQLDIFAVGADNQMYHRYVDQKGDWQPADWESLGGSFVSPPAAVAFDSAGPGLDGVYAFAVGTDDQMYQKLLDTTGVWHPAKTAAWDRLGGVYVSPPAVTPMGDEVLYIFALGTHNEMYVVTDASLGGTFVTIPAAILGVPTGVGSPVITYVLGLGADNQVYCSPNPNSGLSEWEGLGGVWASAPAGGSPLRTMT